MEKGVLIFITLLHQRLFVSGVVLLGVALMQSMFSRQAFSAEFVVDTPTIVTNGDLAHVLDGDDKLEVSKGGSIVVVGNNNGAIEASGANNMINNAGLLSTNGDFSRAIDVFADSSVINTGTIITAGDSSEAIVADGNNMVENRGEIMTAGDDSYGILGNMGNTIKNAGTITTAGDDAFGLAGSANNIFINTGAINTSGVGAFGILSIIGGKIDNQGRIMTTGAGAAGIFAFADSIIDNSGYVVSAQSNSFVLAAVNTLNLMAPSFVGGEFLFGADTTLNITTGRSQSVLWEFDTVNIIGGAPNITGSVPWAWSAGNGQFATLDPTAMSAASDVLADTTGALSRLTRVNGAAEYNEWWIDGYGNFAAYGAQGIFNDYAIINGGIAAGGAFVINDNLSIGTMIGYQANKLKVNSAWMASQSIEGNGMVGAVSANATLKNFFADFTVFSGAQANKSSRLVNDNLAVLGVDYASANYNSWFIAPELRIGMDIETDGEWTLGPSASVRYSLQQIDAYTEVGSRSNADFGARNVQVFEGELELAATRDMASGSVTVRGGAQYRQNIGAGTAEIVLLGQSLSMPVDDSAMLGGYIGGDMSFDVGDMSAFEISASMSAGSGNFISVFGSLGFKGQF